MSYLRDYQEKAREAIFSELTNGSESTLLVCPTGTGKTEILLDVADRWPQGEILFLAHRQELIYQPAERWRKKTDQYAEMVMAEFSASTLMNRGRFLVASVQTLYRENRLRQTFPDPKRVGLVIIDEAHHACRSNRSYQRILEYLAHPDLRILGCTATPDRTDEEALGQTFSTVAFDYPLFDPEGGPSAISDGWLVPIHQEFITIDGLDLSVVKNRGGDFIDSALEQELLDEKILHRITGPTMELAGQKKTLVFSAGITQAIRMAEIFNRARDGSAIAFASRIPEDQRFSFVVNSGDKDERRKQLKRYSRGEYQYLTNMAIFGEGYDEPGISLVSCGRPTKSRSLYAQQVGRGTRVLPGVIEGPDFRIDTPEKRKAAISASEKPELWVLDFVGNSRHPLVSSLDILGGRYADEIVERAKANAKRQGGNSIEALRQAEEEIKRELEQRKLIQARTSFSRTTIDPFGVVGVIPTREPGWHKGRAPTEKMKSALLKFGIEPGFVAKASFHSAGKLIGELIKRREQSLCTYKQAKVLRKYGERTDLTFDQAHDRIDRIAANGWKPLPDAGHEREPGEDG